MKTAGMTFGSTWVLCAAILLGGCGTLTSQPTPEAAANEPQTITVTGTGSANAAPDLATLSVGVIVSDSDITVAIEQSNKTIDAIQQGLQALGIQPADFHTTNFSVWPEDQYDPASGQRLADRNYRVESSLEISVRQVDQVGKVLEAAIGNGANNVYGLNFQIEDTDALASRARAAAVADSRARAAEVASAMGVGLGDAVSATEVSGGTIYPMYAALGQGGGGGEPPISEGQMTVTIQMQVSYLIVR